MMIMEENNKGIAPWQMAMIKAKFNTTKRQEDIEKSYFCVDCAGESLTGVEKDNQHRGHRVLRTYKASHVYGYSRTDILALGSHVLDVSGVRPFSINAGAVYYPKTRSEGGHLKNKGRPGCCLHCGYGIGTLHLFCSILCKLECGQGEQELKTMEMIMAQGDVASDLRKKISNKKRKRCLSPEKKKCKSKARSVSPENKKRKSVTPEKNVKVELLQGLLDAVEDKTNQGLSISKRRRRRKGIPCRAPFF